MQFFCATFYSPEPEVATWAKLKLYCIHNSPNIQHALDLRAAFLLAECLQNNPAQYIKKCLIHLLIKCFPSRMFFSEYFVTIAVIILKICKANMANIVYISIKLGYMSYSS